MEPIVLDLKDGRQHELLFDVSAARWFKRAYQRSIYEVWVMDGSRIEMADPDCTCYLVAAGLRHEDKDITPDKVERMLNKFVAAGGKLRDVNSIVNQAIRRLYRGDDADEEEQGDQGKEG